MLQKLKKKTQDIYTNCFVQHLQDVKPKIESGVTTIEKWEGKRQFYETKRRIGTFNSSRKTTGGTTRLHEDVKLKIDSQVITSMKNGKVWTP